MRVPLTISAISPILERTKASRVAKFADTSLIEVFERGADVEVDDLVEVYDAEVGGEVVEQPLRTDGAGRVEGPEGEEVWVDAGAYDLLIDNNVVAWDAGTPISGALGKDGGAATGLTIINTEADVMPTGWSEDADTENGALVTEAFARLAAEGFNSGRVRVPEGAFPEGAAGVKTPAGFGAVLECPGGRGQLLQGGDYWFVEMGAPIRTGTIIKLAANATRGDETLELETTVGVTLGPHYLKSKLTFGSNAPLGEVVWIDEIIDSKKVGLRGPLKEEEYPTAQEGKLELLSAQPVCAVNNLDFVNPAPDTRTGAKTPGGIKAQGVEKFLSEGVNMDGLDYVGFEIWDCLSGDISDVDLQNFVDNLAAARNGYGMRAVGLTRDLKMHDGTSSNLRHTFTTSGAARDCTISDWTAVNMSNASFDNHAGARHIGYERVKSIGGKSSAVQLRSSDCWIKDCKVIGHSNSSTKISIWAHDSGITLEEYIHNARVEDLYCQDNKGALIRVVNADDVLVDGVVARGHKAEGSTIIYFGETTPNRGKVRNVDVECKGVKVGESTTWEEGYVVYFETGDGHSVGGDMSGKNIQLVVRMNTALTSFGLGGRIRGQTNEQLIGTSAAASFKALPLIEGQGAPEAVVRAPSGTVYVDTTSGQRYEKAGGHTTTGWSAVVTPSVAVLEKSSYLTTIPNRKPLASLAVVTGEALGIEAVAEKNLTIKKLAFLLGSTYTAPTDLRLAICDFTTRAPLAETGNLIGVATLAKEAWAEEELKAALEILVGVKVYLGIAVLGGTVTLMGQSLGAGPNVARSGRRLTCRASYAGGVFPTLGTSISNTYGMAEGLT